VAEGTQVQDPATEPTSPLTDWRAELPEDIRGEKSLADVPDVPTLAKRFVDTKRMVGNAVRIPTPEAKPEEWGAFYEKLGRPKTPAEYTVKPPEGEGLSWSEDGVREFLGAAHKAGLTSQQAQAAVDWYAQYSLTQMDAITQAQGRERAAAAAQLAQEWGASYPRNVGLAKQALAHFADKDPATLEYFEQEIGNDPRVVRLLAKVGAALLEDGEITGGSPMSTADIQARIDAMKNDPNHPVNNPGDPRYDDALNELLELYKQMPGGRETIPGFE
jgi:hypothetical protein